MPYFKWTGIDRNRKKIKGGLMAVNKNDVLIKLRKRKIIVHSIKESHANELFSKSIKEKEILLTTRQLAIMIGAGLPLDESLNIVAEQSTNKKLSEVIYDIRKNIETGSSFANALRRHKKVFSVLYVNMVEAAERSGQLESVLMRLTSMMEKSMAIKRKIKGAMIYPSAVAVVAVAVVTIILTFVIPTFASLYKVNGLPLPLPTRIVINVSYFLQHNIIYFFLAIVAGIMIERYMYKNHYKFRKYIDGMLLKMPIMGTLIRKSSISNFSNILSSLSTSGVEILESLEIAARTSGNIIIEEALLGVKKNVRKGDTLSQSMIESEQFPNMVTQMVSVGEESGSLEDMLDNVSSYYDGEVDNAVKNLTTMIEPVMIIFLGSIIGFIVISMYLPIFEIGNIVH